MKTEPINREVAYIKSKNDLTVSGDSNGHYH